MLSAYPVAESWMEDHERVMSCFDVEDAIAYGNIIFQRLSEYDVTWHAEVFEDEIPYEEGEFNKIQQNYRDWLQVAKTWLPWIKHHEEKDYEVRGAVEFRENCRKATNLFVPDNQFFQGQKLVDLRDRAIDDHRDGRVANHGGGEG